MTFSITMIEDKHPFCDFKETDDNAMTLSPSANNWIPSLYHQSADISASQVQNSLIDIIYCFIPLKSFHRSSFLKWVSPKLKSLLFKKKAAHKKYKLTGSTQDENYYVLNVNLNQNYVLEPIQTFLDLD